MLPVRLQESPHRPELPGCTGSVGSGGTVLLHAKNVLPAANVKTSAPARVLEICAIGGDLSARERLGTLGAKAGEGTLVGPHWDYNIPRGLGELPQKVGMTVKVG